MEGSQDQIIQLIGFDKDHRIFINPKAREMIEGIRSKFIGAICVAGKYRTGKSYLINKVIIQK